MMGCYNIPSRVRLLCGLIMLTFVGTISSSISIGKKYSLRHDSKVPASRMMENGGESIDDDNPIQTKIKNFEYLDSEAIKKSMSSMATSYPDFVTFGTAQEWYGLPTAGGEDDCKFDADVVGCKNYIMIIEDKNGMINNSSIAEVFLSGAVHGNERIGPTTVVETARMLLEAAECEALPHVNVNGTYSDEDIAKAIDCREDLTSRGIFPWVRRWLARLVTTRRIVVVPSANALGYHRNVREENSIDPNRDFAFDQKDWSLCMRTIAGRTINEIFREHIFQHSLTYHGGMVAIAYEWGAPSRNSPKGIPSPDDTAQIQLGLGLSNYAGSFSPKSVGYQYPHDSMNDLVYPVNGGMEDWAYGGSWDLDLVKPCTPSTFGGYDISKTTYNNATLRAFNFLIETSDRKEPNSNTLGSDDGLFNESPGDGNGHISRNVRLAQMMIDTVEPYVSVVAVENIIIDDIIPSSTKLNRTCMNTHIISVPSSMDNIDIFWTVGGSFTIDQTRVAYGKWDNGFDSSLDCYTQPDVIRELFTESTVLTPILSGRSRWHENGALPEGKESKLKNGVGKSIPYGSIFKASISLKEFKVGDKIAVMPFAMVDQRWKDQPSSFTPKVMPQSHVVNVRTNPSWHYESADKVVQGRLHWRAVPITLEINDVDSVLSFKSARLQEETVHVDNDYEESNSADESKSTSGAPSTTPSGKEKSGVLSRRISSRLWIVVMVVVSVLLSLAFFYERNQRTRNSSTFELVAVAQQDQLSSQVAPYSDEDDVSSRMAAYSDEADLSSSVAPYADEVDITSYSID